MSKGSLKRDHENCVSYAAYTLAIGRLRAAAFFH